jgi:hypothetical protein
MKDEIRVLGIDDGYFLKHGDKKVLVVGAVLRGNHGLEGVLSCYIDKDGTDSTKRLISLVNSSKHKNQLRYMMTNGTTLGGFNLLDISELYRKTRVPVLAVLRKKPDQQKVERALSHFPDKRKRLERLDGTRGKRADRKDNQGKQYSRAGSDSASDSIRCHLWRINQKGVR